MSNAILAGKAYIEIFIRDRVQAGLRKINSQLQRFASTTRQLGTTSFAIGGSSSFGISLLINQVGEFDRVLRQAATATDQSFLKQLTRDALDLARASGVSAVAIAGIQRELGLAGIGKTTGELKKAAEAASNVALTQGEDAVLVSKTLIAVFTQFQSQGNSFSSIADKITAAAKNSATSVIELGEALKFAGPIAAATNVPIDDVLALAATLAQVGIEGTNAGTVLRRLLLETAADREGFRNIFGIEATENPIENIEAISRAVQGLDEATAISKIKEFFGIIPISGISGLVNAVDQIRGFQDAVSESFGVAAKDAEFINQGIAGTVNKTKAVLFELADAFVRGFNEPLERILGLISTTSNAVTEFIRDNKELAEAVLIGAASFTALGISLLAVSTLIGSIGTLAGVTAGAIGAVSSPIFAIIGLFSSAVVSVGGIIASVAGIPTAIGVAVAASLAAVAAVPATLGAISVAISAIDFAASDRGKNLFSEISSQARRTANSVVSSFSNSFSAIAGQIQNADFSGAFKTAMADFELIARQSLEGVSLIFRDSFDAVAKELGLSQKAIDGYVSSVVVAFQNLSAFTSIYIDEFIKNMRTLTDFIDAQLGPTLKSLRALLFSLVNQTGENLDLQVNQGGKNAFDEAIKSNIERIRELEKAVADAKFSNLSIEEEKKQIEKDIAEAERGIEEAFVERKARESKAKDKELSDAKKSKQEAEIKARQDAIAQAQRQLDSATTISKADRKRLQDQIDQAKNKQAGVSDDGEAKIKEPLSDFGIDLKEALSSGAQEFQDRVRGVQDAFKSQIKAVGGFNKQNLQSQRVQDFDFEPLADAIRDLVSFWRDQGTVQFI